MEIAVISKETIKPSKPTPAHLRHYRLSFIDQLNGQIFVPFISFYPVPPGPPPPPAAEPPSGDDIIATAAATNLERSKKLKKSLSETLTKYYPLAGRIRNNLYIDCNDKGVDYWEANANCQLSQLLDQSSLAELNKLLPYADPEDTNNLPTAIQVNFFDCGGMAICLILNHNISDACSAVAFANYWAAVARGEGASRNAVDPCFSLLHSLFPPRDIPYKYHPAIQGVLAKRFVFSSSALSALVKEYSGGSMSLSRVQALSAFVFSRLVAATINQETDADSRKKHFLFLLTMNLRARMNPSLNGSHFGNVYGHAVVEQAINGNMTLKGRDLVIKLGDAVRKVDSDFIKQQYTEGLHLISNDGDRCAGKGEVVCFTISSITGFPLCKADFGWGRPIWVSNGKDPLDNTVTFFPTRFGNAIEAVIKLKEEEMVRLESDREFLTFASPASGTKVLLTSSL